MSKYFDVCVKNFDIKYHKFVCYDSDSEILVYQFATGFLNYDSDMW
jgi:hypothetical protein